MMVGHVQFLSDTESPILYFANLETNPFFRLLTRPQGCVVKKFHKVRSECFWANFKFSVFQDPKIPNFCTANL